MTVPTHRTMIAAQTLADRGFVVQPSTSRTDPSDLFVHLRGSTLCIMLDYDGSRVAPMVVTDGAGHVLDHGPLATAAQRYRPDGTAAAILDTIAEAFANAICNAIRAYARTDEDFAEFVRDASGFADLHDVCDANEFIVAAERAVGWEPDVNRDEQVAVLDRALAIVSERLRTGEPLGEPERQVDVGLRVIVSANDARDGNAIARALLKALAASGDNSIAGMYFDAA